MMYSGYVVGVILAVYLVFVASLSVHIHHLLVWLLFVPTLYNAFFQPPRPVKDVTRFLLGIAVVQGYVVILRGLFEATWLISIVLGVGMFYFQTTLTKKRSSLNNSICLSCPEVNNPRCSGLREYHDRKMILEGSAIRLDIYGE